MYVGAEAIGGVCCIRRGDRVSRLQRALWQDVDLVPPVSLKTTLKATIDGAIYAAVTTLTFSWLWPPLSFPSGSNPTPTK